MAQKNALAAACGLVSTLLAVSLLQAQTDPGSRVRELNAQILRLHGQLLNASPAQAAAIGGQAASVLNERAAALAALIEKSPAEAVSFAFSPELVADLADKFPDSALQLESWGTWEGPVERWIFDSADLKSHRSVIRMHAGPQPLEVHFAGAEPKGLKGSDVLEASGLVVGNTLLASSASVQTATSTGSVQTMSTAATAATTAGTCSTTGVQNTAVLLVTFPGVTLPAGVSTQSLNDVFFGTSTGHSVDGFLREASYGQAWATGNVFGTYALTGKYTSCSDVGGAVLNDAIAAATASGVNLNSYTRVVLVFPDVFNCAWAGFANVGGCSISSSSGTFNASEAILAASYVSTRDGGVVVASHEIGHNLGLLHSGIITAGTDVLGPLSSPGTEYDQNGDYWSVMGEWVLGLYPAPQKAEVLGWMKPTTNYQTVQVSGTYTLQPLETSPPGLQALKVQRGTGSTEWLWIEYRQPIGNYDSTLSNQPFSGALIHYEDSNTAPGHTYLANFTPADTTWNHPTLAAGQTWTDPYTNLSISVPSATSTSLTVNVNYGAMPCTRANPTVAMSPANPSVSAGSNVNYTVSVTNNDSSACSANSFSLGSAQPSGWSGGLSAASLALNPGQTASVMLAETVPAGTLGATYSLSSSATSGSYSGSGGANCTVVATPSLTDRLSLSGPVFSARQTVSASAAVLYGNSAAAGATVTFTLTKANGTTVTGTATTNSTGNAVWSYRVAPKDPAGTYSVTSKASYNSQAANSNTATFRVQ